MKIQNGLNNKRAFTVLEALMVVVILMLLAALVLPILVHGGHHQSPLRIQCLNNLKQVGLAFRIFQQDYGEYPMRHSTKDFDAPGFANEKQMFLYFRAISNQITNPKLVICPADDKRSAATNFDADFNSSHVSFFLGLDADYENPKHVLAGDRNIVVKDAQARNGVLEITPNQVSNSNNLTVSWTKEIHKEAGNFIYADAHVEQLNNARLRDALRTSGLATNRLVLP